jgi:peptidyl-prolyl cis-trans isomerase A (cyclophilin A)
MTAQHLAITCRDRRICMQLEWNRAPQTIRNLLRYIELGRLRGSTFHRVLGHANQRGHPAPISAVQGGVAYVAGSTYQPALGLGPIPHESTAITGLKHLDGTVSMARYGPGETYGSFFVCVGAQPQLDFGGRRFTDGQGAAAFGTVIQGMDFFRLLCRDIGQNEFLDPPIEIEQIELVA